VIANGRSFLSHLCRSAALSRKRAGPRHRRRSLGRSVVPSDPGCATARARRSRRLSSRRCSNRRRRTTMASSGRLFALASPRLPRTISTSPPSSFARSRQALCAADQLAPFYADLRARAGGSLRRLPPALLDEHVAVVGAGRKPFRLRFHNVESGGRDPVNVNWNCLPVPDAGRRLALLE